MKIEPKDIKEYLSLKGKINVTGKHLFSLSKTAIKKLKKGFLVTLKTVKEKSLDIKDAVVDTIKETENARLKFEENIQEQIRLKDETRELLEKYPEVYEMLQKESLSKENEETNVKKI